MKKVMVYKKTNLLRRSAAVALDIILTIILFFIVDSVLVTPCFNGFTDYDKKYDEYNTVLVETRLFTLNKYNDLDNAFDNLDERLTYFYETYDNLDNYNQKKAESELFQYDENTSSYIEVGSLDEVSAFYRRTYFEAVEIVRELDEVKQLTTLLGAYNMAIFYLSASISMIIVFLVIPLIFKNGQTVGKKMLNIQVISKINNGKLHPVQLMFRFIIFFAGECVLSIYTFGVPAIAGALFMIFQKEHLSFQDLCCSTVCIDSSKFQKELRENEQIVIEYNEQEITEVRKENKDEK